MPGVKSSSAVIARARPALVSWSIDLDAKGFADDLTRWLKGWDVLAEAPKRQWSKGWFVAAAAVLLELSRDEIDRLLQGRHHNPHSILGAHPATYRAETGVVIRTMHHDATHAEVVTEEGQVIRMPRNSSCR